MSRGKIISLNARIRSIKNILNISRAMSLISSSKFISLRSNLDNVNAFFNNFEDIFSEILLKKFLLEKKRKVLILVSSDRGMSGAYNQNIIKAFNEFIEKNEEELFIISIGKKMNDYLSKHNVEHLSFKSKGEPKKIAKDIVGNLKGELLKSECFMIYSNYHSSKAEVIVENLIPSPKYEENNEEFIFEPNIKNLFNKALIQYTYFKIYRNIISSFVSENYFRMLSMKNASDNATDLIKELEISYNKERQAIITQEILEVVSGTENLEDF